MIHYNILYQGIYTIIWIILLYKCFDTWYMMKMIYIILYDMYHDTELLASLQVASTFVECLKWSQNTRWPLKFISLYNCISEYLHHDTIVCHRLGNCPMQKFEENNEWFCIVWGYIKWSDAIYHFWHSTMWLSDRRHKDDQGSSLKWIMCDFILFDVSQNVYILFPIL